MSEGIQPFNIMAKPVCGVCNLDCDYCYYKAKPRELYAEAARFMMADEVLAAYTRQYIEAMPVRCEFGWQGGEPLIAGKGFFRRAVELQAEHRRDGQSLANSLQTNGTLLDDEWCEFLSDNGFLVGISIDGPPRLHDRHRRDRAGAPTFHRTWAGLELMRKHGVEFNVLATLNSANAPHAGDIYRYFVNRGIEYVQFIPILERRADGEPAEYSCSGEQFGRFYLEVFELWAARDVGKVSERFIDNILHAIVHGRSAMCSYSRRCAAAHALEYNGDLYACDHFVFPRWRVGNIMDTPLAELLRAPMLEEFSRLKTDLPAACGDCEFLPYCRGGCPKHHLPPGTSPGRVNHFCDGYKMFFRHALPELKRIAEYIKAGRAGTIGSARNVPAGSDATAGRRPVPAKPRRNAPCHCGSGRKFKNCCGRARTAGA